MSWCFYLFYWIYTVLLYENKRMRNYPLFLKKWEYDVQRLEWLWSGCYWAKANNLLLEYRVLNFHYICNMIMSIMTTQVLDFNGAALLMGCCAGRWCATTVQTFNSRTRRSDVCQWPVVQIPMNNMSKKGQAHQRPTYLANQNYVQFWGQLPVVASMTRKLGGTRVCGRVSSPGCPRIYCRNLMLELYWQFFKGITRLFSLLAGPGSSSNWGSEGWRNWDNYCRGKWYHREERGNG